jgi:hypothetical protein
MNWMPILQINMIYKIASTIGILAGCALIGVGIGLSISAVIIVGIVLLAIGTISCMMAKMYY